MKVAGHIAAVGAMSDADAGLMVAGIRGETAGAIKRLAQAQLSHQQHLPAGTAPSGLYAAYQLLADDEPPVPINDGLNLHAGRLEVEGGTLRQASKIGLLPVFVDLLVWLDQTPILLEHTSEPCFAGSPFRVVDQKLLPPTAVIHGELIEPIPVLFEQFWFRLEHWVHLHAPSWRPVLIASRVVARTAM